jgi:1,2-phenylacetyl-CoA epoxidase PaaB subunit
MGLSSIGVARQDEGMSGEVLFDGWCGEPIAWARIGDPVIGQEWTEHGWVAVTERLTPAEAVRKYGPITEVVLGRQGGFQSVAYGTKKFVCKFVDPRGTGLYGGSVVVVNDPVKDDHECPVCEAAPGEQCVDDKGQPRGTHRKRREGRSRWEIERAEAEARAAQEKAEAAAQWERDMATPPALGAAVEIERRKLSPEYQWIPDGADRFTVEHTYSNRTIKARAESDDDTFLARNEYTGDWHTICGQPTSMRLPCRNGGAGVPCRIRHKAGLSLREDDPWT